MRRWYEELARRLDEVYDWFADPDVPAWRTWLGHSLVWGGFQGAGASAGWLAGGLVALVGLVFGYDPWVGLWSLVGAGLGYVAGLVFYGRRELGDYRKHSTGTPRLERRGKLADTKMDLWVPWIINTAGLAAYASLILY